MDVVSEAPLPRLPADPQAQWLTALIDSREQQTVSLAPLPSEQASLPTGDYSIRGLEHVIAVERKSLPDLLAVCGRDRERFDREVQRLLAYPARCLVVEGSWADLLAGGWRSELTPQQVIGSVTGWMASGLPVALVGSHEEAGKFIAKFLFIAARRRWREARALVDCCMSAREATP
jgi:ERCC4-type nuclease